LQILNVYRSGTLLQHIESPVNHEAGRKVPVAHDVEIEAGSKLAEIVGASDEPNEHLGKGTSFTRAEKAADNAGALAPEGGLIISANSSHHQSADVVGDGLKITARCPEDGIIEAIEGTSPDHFVVAVQWHPERSFEEDERSRRIFRALVEAAKEKHLNLVGEFEGA
jgi:putative glutamine amidotransferase